MKKQLSLLTLLALAACGGGAGSSLPTTASGTQPQLQNVGVQFRISIPAAIGRVPQYISSATKSAQITVTPTGGTALAPVVLACTTTCQGTVSAPVGSDTFAVALYDQTGASGNTLSSGSATQTIVAGQANSVMLTFGGVVANIAIALGATSVTGSGSTPVTVTAKDAASQTIVGSAAYINPITLTNSDTSGATTLSTTAVTSPNTVVTLNYTNALTTAQIGATASNVATSQVTGATISKAVSLPAGFMNQTSATKASGTVPAGATSAIGVAISGVPDQSGAGALNTASVTFGSGTMATSVGRVTLSMYRGKFGGIHGAHDRAPDVQEVETVLKTMSHSGRPQAASRVTQSVLPSSLVVGATASIWVHASTYVQVPSTLEFNSTHGHIWVDNSLISGGSAVPAFNSSNINSTVTQIGADFDNAYTSDVAHYGTPDYTSTAPGAQLQYNACDSTGAQLGTTVSQYIPEPSDGMIDVMVLNPNLLGGFGGYFSATNFTPQAIWNCGTTAHSNEAPFIFVGWFDGNTPGSRDSYNLQEDLVRGTAHEFQHFINFINHSILATGANSYGFSGHEHSFINEGMSMLSQDFAVHQLRSNETFDSDDALYNASFFIAHPEDVNLTAHYGKDSPGGTAQSGCSACYGGDYMFMRYMYDRFGGDTFIKNMTTSGITGFPNLVANATGSSESANQLLSDFGVAMAANAAGITQTGAFNLGTLNLSGTYPGVFSSNTLPGLGFAAPALGPNASATVNAPLGGYAFVQLTSIPGSGEPVTINDPGGTFSLIGGFAQH
ncbi:MAG: hypothetical protein ABR584_09215 [Candidatus Baltobacteraceae bacterium]